MYPKDTAGVVLDDAAHEDEPVARAEISSGAPGATCFVAIDSHFVLAASEVGLLRVTGSSPAGDKNEAQMTREELIAELRHQPKSFLNNVDAGMVLNESYAEARAIPSLGDIPLIVLTAGSAGLWRCRLNPQAIAYQKILGGMKFSRNWQSSPPRTQIVVPDRRMRRFRRK